MWIDVLEGLKGSSSLGWGLRVNIDLKIYFYFMCMGFCLFVYVLYACLVPLEASRGHQNPQDWG